MYRLPSRGREGDGSPGVAMMDQIVQYHAMQAGLPRPFSLRWFIRLYRATHLLMWLLHQIRTTPTPNQDHTHIKSRPHPYQITTRPHPLQITKDHTHSKSLQDHTHINSSPHSHQIKVTPTLNQDHTYISPDHTPPSPRPPALDQLTASIPSKSNIKGDWPKLASTISPGVCKPTAGYIGSPAYKHTHIHTPSIYWLIVNSSRVHLGREGGRGQGRPSHPPNPLNFISEKQS